MLANIQELNTLHPSLATLLCKGLPKQYPNHLGQTRNRQSNIVELFLGPVIKLLSCVSNPIFHLHRPPFAPVLLPSTPKQICWGISSYSSKRATADILGTHRSGNLNCFAYSLHSRVSLGKDQNVEFETNFFRLTRKKNSHNLAPMLAQH